VSRSWRGDQGHDLVPVEVRHLGSVAALEGDGENTLNELGVFGVAIGGEPKEGVDGSQTSVAGTAAVTALVL